MSHNCVLIRLRLKCFIQNVSKLQARNNFKQEFDIFDTVFPQINQYYKIIYFGFYLIEEHHFGHGRELQKLKICFDDD